MNTPLMSVFIPLTPFAHQNAQKCAANQFTPEDRKLTYLKVLAIHALQDYLLYEHDLESEANRHYLDWPGLSDAATLYLPMLDREIECCPVLADDESFTLSQLTLERCAAHVAVRFSDDLTEAELLGFSPAVDPNDPPDCIYLEELLPIASLHQRLEEVARIVAWLNTDNPLTQELKALVAEAEQQESLAINLDRVVRQNPQKRWGTAIYLLLEQLNEEAEISLQTKSRQVLADSNTPDPELTQRLLQFAAQIAQTIDQLLQPENDRLS